MIALIRLDGVATLKKNFVSYNFKQVRDAAVLLFFVEETKQFKKIFIYKNVNGWETDLLRRYIDDEPTHIAFCKKLQDLFRLSKDGDEDRELDTQQASGIWHNIIRFTILFKI